MKKLALAGGSRIRSREFPNWPIFDDLERRQIDEVLNSGKWWRNAGSKVIEFEQSFAEYHEAKYGIATSNGTHALEAVLLALDIGPGDEIIIPDFTFVATATAVLSTGALPVMVDISPSSYCIDPLKAEEAITPQSKAIIAVHLAGCPADMDRLTGLCREKGLFLIEDSSHAHGTEFKRRKIGAIGTAGTFSFQAGKTITAGEGGIVLTNDKQLADRVRSVHDCGRKTGEWTYSHHIYGSNYRMTEWQGAVLLAQKTRLDSQVLLRHENAQTLDQLLKEISGITPQQVDLRCTRNGHYSYIFHFDSSHFSNLSIERFVEALNAEGIPTQSSYPPIHRLDLFRSGMFRRRVGQHISESRISYLGEPFPATEKAASETVWLRHYALLGNKQDTEEIAAAIRKIKENISEIL